MNKKEFLQEKYEEINRLKISIQDYPKESIDNILKSISNICDEINKHLEGKNNKKNIEINDNNSKTYEDNYDYNIEDNINNDVENKKKNKKSNEINHNISTEEIMLTVQELSEFNGRDGKPPYVAIDGIVYDLSKINKWKDGKHHGMLAGQVLTEEYYRCHSKKLNLIKKSKVVGRLKEENRVDNVFTKEELSKYDGKNGRPVYAAINGIVYDFTKILQWQGGMHYGLMAGQDLTAYFGGCHSDNLDILKNGTIVGTLDETRQALPEYTIGQLANFDGTGGQLAYIAISGTVYDVTSIKQWDNGKHHGLKAGKDVTEFFNTCHKDEQEILSRLKVVGTLRDS
ncbi:Predicted heme/steroid binding protein [uncultured Clostridium sp.]|uniref:cytochrome b5 domain-containing protein n=1 Tax=uncultured Clostridium sp. TaxID=59620 RepID=UPI000821B1F8|nr:cytochrome b5 domain-containing protein [uncultured Clostridium sp.]SCJ95063.1 Predicted heme/steroid binding protein [uncultured Clostridium sp.]